MSTVPALAVLLEDSPIKELITTHPRLPLWTTYIAVGFGSLSGAAFAARRGFDAVGVAGLATAQGLGGLLLTSVLLATGTPFVLTDPWYLVIVAVTAVLGFFFAGLMARTVQSLLVLDALSLGLLCAVGTNQALRNGLDNVPAVFIGVVTAIGGFILRDVLAGRAPEVLRPGIFISAAAFIGALTFVLLVNVGASRAFAQLTTVLLVTALRLLSVRRGWETHEPRDLSDRVWGIWRRERDRADP